MEIRLAVAADAPGIWELHCRSIREICSADYAPEQIEAWAGPKQPADYLSRIKAGRIFVAVDDGRLTGFGEFREELKEICALYVHPDFVRKGIGRRLFLRVVDELRALGMAQAQLDASLTSERFYAAMGCRKIGERLHPLRKGVAIPCVRMQIEL